MADPIRVRVVAIAVDRDAADAFLEANHTAIVARGGELLDARAHEALLAVDGMDELLGVATFVVRGDQVEVLTLHAARKWAGAGTALLEAVAAVGRERGCDRLWLVTTNDNLDALRFYQRRGLRIRAVRPGAVEEARRSLKPTIPELGSHGIPIRDEIELDRRL